MAGNADVWAPSTEISGNTKSDFQSFTAEASQTLFTLTKFSYTVGTGALVVFKNGLLLEQTIDWIEKTATTISLLAAASLNDVVIVYGHLGLEATLIITDPFPNTTAMIASEELKIGDIVDTAGFDNAGDAGGNRYLIQEAGTDTPDGGSVIDLVTYQAKALFPGGVLRAEQYGVIGDNASSPYASNWVNFMLATANFGMVTFPNTTIHVNNSAGPVSFQSNCTYEGGPNTFIQPNTFTQRVFLTQSKTNFIVRNLRSYINEASGGEDVTIGGGYWRFEFCTRLQLNTVEVSKSFSAGIKLSLCTDFVLYKVTTNYNQFNGVELEGCSNYLYSDYESNYNGKYSSDNSYKPLPIGWTGTHGGRGWTVAANGDTLDQKNSVIQRGKCLQNSEYGVRCFTATSKGITNLKILDLETENSGAPAGTYGTIVLGADKGVEILINSDALGASANIKLIDIVATRSFGFGTGISMDGVDHLLDRVTITFTGAAVHNVVAVAIFGGSGFISRNLHSEGAASQYSFGSGLPTNVTFEGDIAKNCKQGHIGTPDGGINAMHNCHYFHRATTAVVGEEGMDITTLQWNMSECSFDGFWRGLDITVAAPKANITNCTTTNSVNTGVEGTPVTNQDDLIVESNNFDSSFPAILGSFVSNRRGGLNKQRVINNANPATGGTGSGALMNWKLGDEFESSLGTVGTPKGWICTTAGTPGVWTSTGNL